MSFAVAYCLLPVGKTAVKLTGKSHKFSFVFFLEHRGNVRLTRNFTQGTPNYKFPTDGEPSNYDNCVKFLDYVNVNYINVKLTRNFTHGNYDQR